MGEWVTWPFRSTDITPLPTMEQSEPDRGIGILALPGLPLVPFPVLQGGGKMHQVNGDSTIVEGKIEKAGAVRFVRARLLLRTPVRCYGQSA